MLPSSIFFINSDINDIEKNKLKNQLFIDDTMTKKEFDARIVADPNYSTIIHLQGMRILVILPTFQDYVNRNLADVVMFLHQGLADIECNRFGPPGQSYPIDNITFYELLRSANSTNVISLPFYSLGTCNSCNSPFYCDACHTSSGVRICSSCSCGCKCFCNIQAPNCDNEAHNFNFINRK